MNISKRTHYFLIVILFITLTQRVFCDSVSTDDNKKMQSVIDKLKKCKYPSTSSFNLIYNDYNTLIQENASVFFKMLNEEDPQKLIFMMGEGIISGKKIEDTTVDYFIKNFSSLKSDEKKEILFSMIVNQDKSLSPFINFCKPSSIKLLSLFESEFYNILSNIKANDFFYKKAAQVLMNQRKILSENIFFWDELSQLSTCSNISLIRYTKPTKYCGMTYTANEKIMDTFKKIENNNKTRIEIQSLLTKISKIRGGERIITGSARDDFNYVLIINNNISYYLNFEPKSSYMQIVRVSFLPASVKEQHKLREIIISKWDVVCDNELIEIMSSLKSQIPHVICSNEEVKNGMDNNTGTIETQWKNDSLYSIVNKLQTPTNPKP